jgi:hypothetical protein
MNIEELEAEALWRYYQRGYHCLIRSGLYFRALLRPALSHVYFLRALPLLQEYARANHGAGDLPIGFGEKLDACPLTPRDLLHLDYAICLGYAEVQGEKQKVWSVTAVMGWPGPPGGNGIFIPADALALAEMEAFAAEFAEMEEEEEAEGEEDSEDSDPTPPFDL